MKLEGSHPVVGVVIVTFNDARWIDACLEAISGSDEYTHVVVVDNCSSDQTVARVQAHPGVSLLRNEFNLGFAAANNQGVEYLASNCSHSLIMLLNPDTKIHASTIRELRHFCEANPSFAVLGPMQYRYQIGLADGDCPPELTSWTKRMVATQSSYYMGNYFKRFRVSDRVDEDSQVMSCAYVQGSAFMFRSNLYLSLGGFDEYYFMCHEEVDYCRRVSYLGYKIGLLKGVGVEHANRDLEAATPLRVFLRRRNRYLYALTDPRLSLTEASLLSLRFLFADIRRLFHVDGRTPSRPTQVLSLIRVLGWFFRNSKYIRDARLFREFAFSEGLNGRPAKLNS